MHPFSHWSKSTIIVPRQSTSKFGMFGLSYQGPVLGNKLPGDIRSTESLSKFSVNTFGQLEICAIVKFATHKCNTKYFSDFSSQLLVFQCV